MPKVARIKGSPAVATARAGGGSAGRDGANDTHAPWTRRAEEVTAYHQAILGRSGAGDGRTQVSFQALYPRRTNRPAQVEASRKFRGRCKIRYNNVWADGDALDPGSFVWSRINTKDKMFSIDNSRCHLYWEEVQRKSGVACRGDTRTAAGYGANAKLASSIDLDNMPEQSQRKMTKNTLRIAGKSGCEDHPMTLGDFLLIDMYGVSAPTQMLFRGMTKERDDCAIVGGVFKVWGVLRAVVRKILETGQQESLRERGIEITGDLHEWVNNDSASYCARLDHSTLCDVDAAVLEIFTPEEREVVKHSRILAFLLQGWPPGRTKSWPKKGVSSTGAISDKVARGRWGDAFDGPPVKNPESVDEGYDPKYYTSPQRAGARGTTLDKVGHLERHGGCGGFEVNGEAWKETKSGSLVEYLLNERVTLLGHQPGKGWKIAYRKTRYGIWVLKLKWDKDDFIRVIVVFIPWCTMMHYKNGEAVQWWDLIAYERAALSAHWVGNFFQILEEPNSTLVTNKSLDRLLEDNIAFQFGIYVAETKLVGVNQKAGNLLFKNRLEGSTRNLLHPDYTNLLRNCNETIYGYPCRNKRARYAAEDEELPDGEAVTVSKKQKRITRDNLFVKGALMKASYEADDDDEMVESLLYSIEHDRLHDDAECDSDKSKRRLEAILAKDKAIPRAVREELEAEYDATRHNSGNRTNHSSVTRGQMEDMDDILRYYADRVGTPAGRFFVMGNGTATGDTPKNQDGTPFVEPEDGTLLECEPGKGWRASDRVAFRKADFVPLTHGGLETRTRAMTTAGLTDSKQCEKFTGFVVRRTPGICRYTSKTWRFLNSRNVIEVYLERKPQKKSG